MMLFVKLRKFVGVILIAICFLLSCDEPLEYPDPTPKVNQADLKIGYFEVDFTVSKTLVGIDEMVELTSLTEGDKYRWIVAGGVSENTLARKAKFYFSTAGFYSVTLFIERNGKWSNLTKHQIIEVREEVRSKIVG